MIAVAAALFALPLMGAESSSLLAKPSVIVYPFTVNASSINSEASARLATIIATQMANSGRVSVIPPPPGTERKDFLAVARAHGADYYIAGFMSSLGTGVSVVEQLVSTTSGIVVYSNTVQLTTYADAAGQGDDLAAFVSRHANRGLASIGTPPPANPSTAAPSAEAQANIGKLFARKKRTASPSATPQPTPAPSAPALLVATPHPTAEPVVAVPSPPPPPVATTAPASPAPQPAAAPAPKAVAAHATAPALVVLTIGGSADAALRDAATARIASQTHAEHLASVAVACADRTGTVLSGVLSVRTDDAYGTTSANFELIANDCGGKLLWSRGFSNDAGGVQSARTAMERVVDAAVNAYLTTRKPQRG